MPQPTRAEIAVLIVRLQRLLGFPVELIDRRSKDDRLESLTFRLAPPGIAALEMDVAHVETFEASTWEPAPRDLATLVGATGHTMHARQEGVQFRLATWVDSFDPATIAVAVTRRLERLPG